MKAPIDFFDYEGFLAKFEPKKTSDDCYTPPAVFDAIRDWVFNTYKIDTEHPVMRPFYPGGDFERERYFPGDLILDNPPFSILSKIITFYLANNVRFFLFAPALTSIKYADRCTVIYSGAEIVYANGAKVATCFITNIDPTYRVRTEPELGEAIIEAVKASRPTDARAVYTFPENVYNGARLDNVAGVLRMRLTADQIRTVGNLDAMRRAGKCLFGGGLLIGAEAGAKAAKAAKAAANERARTWELSTAEAAAVELCGATPAHIEVAPSLVPFLAPDWEDTP